MGVIQDYLNSPGNYNLTKTVFSIEVTINPKTLRLIKDISRSTSFTEDNEVLIGPGAIFYITNVINDGAFVNIHMKLMDFEEYLEKETPSGIQL